MRFKLAALPLMLVAATSAAENYNSITSAGYSNLDFDENDGNQVIAETTYYFDSKESLGPLNEFEYINKASNLSGAFNHFDQASTDEDSFAVAGEYFTNFGLVLGASLANIDDEDINTASLGYLVVPNFLVKLSYVDGDEFSEDDAYAEFRYSHQLSGSDYVGFDLITDDDFEKSVFSSKYYADLGGDQYLTAEFSYSDYENSDSYWQIGADYFLNQRTSLGAKFDENEDVKVGFSHFVSRNVAVEASYSTIHDDGLNIRSFGLNTYGAGNNIDIDVDKFELGFTVQL
ncbi:putative porin [Microbulbifer sp. VAAF005]|uniref:putative porin n=1 Tax=Microbulbifer sp. VAAF005 TaxID=3034230 RepID=UPI0024AE7257|nr:putative porin [Microbulbifer sp. VAAF005]WHI44899.1 putative porin [Microbulbifer sp. VAAF005]